MNENFQTILLGATGYVGGELLRLLAGHPNLTLLSAVSESRQGEPIAGVFPHLAGSYPLEIFDAPGAIVDRVKKAESPLVAFSAANHGASAGAVASLLEIAGAHGKEIRVVDMSADFRYSSAAAYEKVYGAPHEAPSLIEQFRCGIPEHLAQTPKSHLAHPGCFSTAVLLAMVPLLHAKLVEPDLFVTGITGSTGSGRQFKETTHHPERHSNLFAYNPLQHRHLPEMTGLAEEASGVRPRVHFVPHSGPFARGIHVTLQARTTGAYDDAAVVEALRRYYREAPFVRVVEGTPRLKDVVGSNFCHLGARTNGESLAVFSVLDNLVKGAAGGAIQWMNRMLAIDETVGLTQASPGWI